MSRRRRKAAVCAAAASASALETLDQVNREQLDGPVLDSVAECCDKFAKELNGLVIAGNGDDGDD